MWHLSNMIPRTFSQKNLVNGERLIAIVHRHLFHFMRRIIVPVIIGFLVGVIALVGLSNISKVSEQYKAPVLIACGVLCFIFFAVLSLRILSSWINHKFDVLIITSQRVISIDRHFISGQTVKEVSLNRITTIRTDVHNIFANMIGYARLDIDSADDGQHIKFDYAPKVEQIRTIITEAKENFLHPHVEKTPEVQAVTDQNILEHVPITSKTFALEQEIEMLKNDYSLLQQKVEMLEQHIQNIYSNKQ